EAGVKQHHREHRQGPEAIHFGAVRQGVGVWAGAAGCGGRGQDRIAGNGRVPGEYKRGPGQTQRNRPAARAAFIFWRPFFGGRRPVKLPTFPPSPHRPAPEAPMKPSVKPANPNFSSGPCSKRPGYDLAALDTRSLGRSHRAAIGKDLLGKACSRTAEILGLPEGYRVGVVPASDTGAVEMALWSLLGPRKVQMFAWESFGEGWVTDVVKQLKLDDVEVIKADYGQLPDLGRADPAADVVFT